MIELARKLGKAIAESPQAGRLKKARQAMQDKPELSQIMRDFQQQSEKIAKLESENKPVEVADKHTLRELNEKLAASEVFKEFTAAQVEYVDLMRRVNEALQSHMGDADMEQNDAEN